MDVAVMRRGVCVDAAVFGDLETAERFLALGVWPGADGVLALGPGAEIGDRVVDGRWVTDRIVDGEEEWT